MYGFYPLITHYHLDIHLLLRIEEEEEEEEEEEDLHQYLVLIDLEQHGVQDEAGGLGHVEGLLRLRQPVDGVLQGALEARGQGQSLLQLPLGTDRGGEESLSDRSCTKCMFKDVTELTE